MFWISMNYSYSLQFHYIPRGMTKNLTSISEINTHKHAGNLFKNEVDLNNFALLK